MIRLDHLAIGVDLHDTIEAEGQARCAKVCHAIVMHVLPRRHPAQQTHELHRRHLLDQAHIQLAVVDDGVRRNQLAAADQAGVAYRKGM